MNKYETIAGYQGFDFIEENQAMPYRLFVPLAPAPVKGYPLMLLFHGMGGAGTDNKSNLIAIEHFSGEAFQHSYPCYILVPQCTNEERWVDAVWNATSHHFRKEPMPYMALAIKLLQQIITTRSIDETRIYVGGASMGGFATWDIISRMPERFAAAFPVCGGGDIIKAPSLTKLPIWSFHGALDTVVLPSSSRDMTEAIKAAGGIPKYTEFPNVAHDSWINAFSDMELFDWCFSKRLLTV